LDIKILDEEILLLIFKGLAQKLRDIMTSPTATDDQTQLLMKKQLVGLFLALADMSVQSSSSVVGGINNKNRYYLLITHKSI
jgi:hypothetical protein